MSKRHQSVVNKYSEEQFSENHWLKKFEESLQKTSVQPRSQSLFDEINAVMRNSHSKYPSVQAAVDDMMKRSGLIDYLNGETVKLSEDASDNKKTAQTSTVNENTPEVIKQKPSILNTLKNIIRETRGNIPVPAIISRLRSLHLQDISDENAWDDEKLVRLVSLLNLQAKKDNPNSYETFDRLGENDHASDSEIDASNTDAFNALMPVRF